MDSTGHDGWHEPDQSSELLSKMDCLVAGYLIEDKPEGIVVALGAGGVGQLLDSMAIPRAAIVSIERLAPPPERSAEAAPLDVEVLAEAILRHDADDSWPSGSKVAHDRGKCWNGRCAEAIANEYARLTEGSTDADV